jgi:hypothetical protein
MQEIRVFLLGSSCLPSLASVGQSLTAEKDWSADLLTERLQLGAISSLMSDHAQTVFVKMHSTREKCSRRVQ